MDISRKFKHVWLVDSFSPAFHHEQYNASMAMMLSSVFDRIVYWVGDGQKESVAAKWREVDFIPSVIEFRRLKVSKPRRTKKDIISSHLHSAWYNISILLRTKRDSLVIYNYNNPPALLLLKLVNAFMRRSIIIINHGELEFIALDPSIPLSRTTRRIGKIFGSLLRFGRGGKNIFYLVLGDSIKKNLEALDLVDSGQIISLDHPYLFDKKAAERVKSGTIKTVGVKNFPAGFDTDEWIRKLAAAYPDITFSIIGMPSAVSGENIENHATGKLRSRVEHERILSRMDAMIFLYPNVEYKLKASGAIFDCLELGIPAISVHNDYFDHLFRLHGPLGYLFDDLSSMLEYLPDILRADHTAIRRNIAAARKYHSPENLTGVLHERLTESFCP